MDLKCPQKETESEQMQFNDLYLLQHVNIYSPILFLYYSCKNFIYSIYVFYLVYILDNMLES